jgi:lipid A ethanolaminephosphotransferase
LPYALAPDAQTHVPMLSWVSPAMAQRLNLRLDCLREHADAPLSHDNLFHAMLGLLDVQTDLYNRKLDWFAACRGWPMGHPRTEPTICLFRLLGKATHGFHSFLRFVRQR